MGDTTHIEWTDHTFNPHMGCQRVSPGCGRAKGRGGCYAEALVGGIMGYRPASADPRRRMTLWGAPSTSTRQRTSAENWAKPLRWDAAAKRDGVRRRVFCASLGDVFEDHPDLPAVRADLWPLIEACDGLDWQLLTKRPENVRAMVPPAWLAAWPAHVWIGTTVEDQQRAEERIPRLLEVPARVRFLSCEPLLGALDLRRVVGIWETNLGDFPRRLWDCPRCLGSGYFQVDPYTVACSACSGSRHATRGTRSGIAWVIGGGESGPGHEPMDLAHLTALHAQVTGAGAAFFTKQDSGPHPGRQGRIPAEVWATKQFPKRGELFQ